MKMWKKNYLRNYIQKNKYNFTPGNKRPLRTNYLRTESTKDSNIITSNFLICAFILVFEYKYVEYFNKMEKYATTGFSFERCGRCEHFPKLPAK